MRRSSKHQNTKVWIWPHTHMSLHSCCQDMSHQRHLDLVGTRTCWLTALKKRKVKWVRAKSQHHLIESSSRWCYWTCLRLLELGCVVCWWSLQYLVYVGLDDPKGLFQPQWFNGWIIVDYMNEANFQKSSPYSAFYQQIVDRLFEPSCDFLLYSYW